MKKAIAVLCAALAAQGTVHASDLSEWALTDYESASRAGLIAYDTAQNSLSGNITRGEFCELLIKLFKTLSDKEIYTPEVFPFEDSDSIPVAQAYALGIVSGRTETEFKPDDEITREEMAKLIVNTLKSAEINLVTLKSEAEEILSGYSDSANISPWAFSEVATAMKYSVISGVSDTLLLPESGATREQAIAMINRVYTQFAAEKAAFTVPEFTMLADNVDVDNNLSFEMTPVDGAAEYMIIVKDTNGNAVETLESVTPDIKPDFSALSDNMKYTVSAGVRYASGVEAFSLPIDIVYKSSPNVMTVVKKDKATLTAKGMRVFPGGYLFETEEEAAANMVLVTVDVWTIGKNGEKVAAKKSLQVNQFLAEDVVNIFREIFEDPSQFPIKSVGGYCWRTTAFGSVSQHSYGTCIDINPDENYYCHSADGTAITGTHWSPYEDQYSITPDGAVVAAFAKYGWIWGGSWDGSVKDYMHFSYLGK